MCTIDELMPLAACFKFTNSFYKFHLCAPCHFFFPPQIPSYCFCIVFTMNNIFPEFKYRIWIYPF